MNVHKRNQELKCVQLLQEKCKELEGYELKFGSDPPDILAIKHGSKSIAVEVSRIYSDDEGKGKGSIEQLHIKTCQKIVKRCDELNKAINSDRCFFVTIYFGDVQLKDDWDMINKISEQLVTNLNNANMKAGEMKDFKSEPLFGNNWPEEILMMSAYCLPNEESLLLNREDEIEWTFSWSGWVGKTSYTMLQDIITEKESSLSRFKDDTDLRWLLLVCPSTTITSTLETHDLATSETYKSNFDKVFILDCYLRVTELLIIKNLDYRF